MTEAEQKLTRVFIVTLNVAARSDEVNWSCTDEIQTAEPRRQSGTKLTREQLAELGKNGRQRGADMWQAGRPRLDRMNLNNRETREAIKTQLHRNSCTHLMAQDQAIWPLKTGILNK